MTELASRQHVRRRGHPEYDRVRMNAHLIAANADHVSAAFSDRVAEVAAGGSPL